MHTYKKGVSHGSLVMMHDKLRILIGDLTLNLQGKKERKERRKELEWRVTLIQALLLSLSVSVSGETVLRVVLKEDLRPNHRRLVSRKLPVEEIVERGI